MHSNDNKPIHENLFRNGLRSVPSVWDFWNGLGGRFHERRFLTIENFI